ncbi:membrane protein [Mycolicibacterium wolinskyi]|uniref:Membrane protein n=1 Tax=Mycolicibacterium wolinskyi TaxID=59750 RepID=A0A132PPS0_9MYCO|nr:hypothetical protein [Mycolicibacterium wolinskyi]KWX24032.1 membrane protein [Mycolicibacterium wolinskyi]
MAGAAADVFVHIRIIVGMVLGLSLARLVNGMTRFIQHPKRDQVYSVHILWTVFMLSAIVHFWWYEFGLSRIDVWTFEMYFFVLFYATLYVAIASLLYPDKMDDYAGFQDYFESRRKWFYSLLAVMFLIDLVDTAIKGADYFHSLGTEYVVKQVVLVVCSLIAVFVADKRYHLTFVVVAIVYQVFWIVRLFDVLQ